MRRTVQVFPAVLLLLGPPLLAQTNEDNIPVAPPASRPATPPVALPVDVPPVAQPASRPATPPVALPVEPPVAQPASRPAAPPVAQPVTSPVAPPAPAPVAPPPAQPAQPDTSGLVIVAAPAAARFDAALALFNAGKYAEAVTAFSDFVQAFPQDRHREEALYRLAESYRSLNRLDDAAAAYTYELQAYPEGPLRTSAEFRLGAVLFAQEKYSDAVIPLQYVIANGNSELQQAANYLLGRAYLATQKEADGRTLLQAFVNQQPPGKFSGSAAQALADLDDTQGKTAEALPLWQKALALTNDPVEQATFATRGGWDALTLKQPDAAEKLFVTARKTATGDTRKAANTGLLRVLYQQKRYAEWLAIYTAEKDTLLESAQAETLFALGHTQFSLKHWPEALAAFDQYLAAYSAQDAAAAAAASYERFLSAIQVDPTQTVPAAEAYLKAYPDSAYRAQIQLLEAQSLSRDKKYAEALPLWQILAQQPAKDGWPRQQILLEIARCQDELNNPTGAATAYQAYLDDLSAHPLPDRKQQAKAALQAQARLAILLQKTNQLLAATEAWKAVQSLAPKGSTEQQLALESLALIYARGGPAQEKLAVATFRTLIDNYPKSQLGALGAFTVGDSLFRDHDYGGAEPYLLKARATDAKTWTQPATQRLVLAAYGLKDYGKTVAYLQQYEALPKPTDPVAAQAARLPAAIFYWLAETARKAGKWDQAEDFYSRVTRHPDASDLLAGAWWQLGEVQSQRKEWPAAVISYGKYRELKPESKDATVILLALGRANLGAGNLDEAKKLGDKALLQEPEGKNSAAARLLLGEIAFAQKDYAQATKMFVPLAVLFDDPAITPQAMSRAADAFEKMGKTKEAADYRQKLKDKYPQYQPASYL